MQVARALREPLPFKAVLGLSVALAGAVALYCAAYNGLAGRSESLWAGVAWAAVNVIPWFLGFEAAKRVRPALRKCGMLGLALLVSMLLHLLVYGPPPELLFELVRRLPALIGVAALLTIPRRAGSAAAAGELPLLPSQIDWVSAAGNYVELHGSGRIVVHRASLSAVEAALTRRGFVRIHRSTLVRREAIARVRAVDLLLRDGTSLKLGKRYRSGLVAPSGGIRPLVPAE